MRSPSSTIASLASSSSPSSAVRPRRTPPPRRASRVPFRATEGDGVAPREQSDVPTWAADLRFDELTETIVDGSGKPLEELNAARGTLNANGATRFDLAVRALRGEYDVPSTERDDGEIMDTLTSFPAKHVFQIATARSDAEDDAFVRDVAEAVRGNGAFALRVEEVNVKPRNKKFSAIWVSAWVHSARDVREANARVRANGKVKFVF